MENSSQSCAEKEALLHQLRVYTFAVIEANLYLDTHPEDQKALAFYQEHLRSLESLKAQWDALTPAGWSWVETPWPWQSEL